MNTVSTCYDVYGDFLRERYFTEHFEAIPSKLSIMIPMEVTCDNIGAVLGELKDIHTDVKTIFKKWHTSPNKEADISEDFPCEYFLVSTNRPLCIWVNLSNNELDIEYLYDHRDQALEDETTNSYRNIRDAMGKTKSPIFKVLTKSNGDFYTESININNFKVDVNRYYNDDFQIVDQIVNSSLQKEMSGLILFHGPPGTGKTSYIKHLLSQHKTLDFIFITNDFVHELLHPDFISFLIAHRNSILVIEDAEKVISSREQNSNSVVSTILQLTDGLFSDYLNIKIICTFNTSIEKIDKALLRKGRMIAFYQFGPLSAEKTQALLEDMNTCASKNNKAMTLAEIFNLNKHSFENPKKAGAIGFKR